ncbi:hypothetical protein V3C99_001329 [Haemonchus contortus]
MHLPLLFLLFGLVWGDSYNEQLKITRLPSGNLMTEFRFVITSDGPQLGANYSLFPRIMAELIHSHSLAELSFMLTQGRWHGSSWGLPPQPNGPTGASVHAWVYGNETEVDDRWRTLINSLNGLFCTAMTSIVPELTSSPRFAFERPASDKEHEMHIRYSAVGKESVCTENLTPWRKLLPCKQHGLVTLLNPLKLYESVYHSMGVELRQSGEGDSINYQLQLIIYNVLDIPVKSGKLDWSISELFNRKATGTCAAATSSMVIVELDKGIHLEPPPQRIVSDKFGVYDLKMNSSSENYTTLWQGSLNSSIAASRRSLEGRINMMEFWCLSLKMEVFKIHKRHFVPAISRRRPALIEMELDLPSRSKCQVRLEFEKAFLRIREYPPDANHGMYVPAAIVTFEKERDSDNSKKQNDLESKTRLETGATERIVVHGNVLLLALPVPDFSMPFNVICFVMTTVSLCFGPIHSFSTKILIPINTALPSSSLPRKLFRMVLLILLGVAFYAQYREMSLHEIRRSIEQFFEKMNSV